MATILALETSSDACCVALRAGDALHVEEHDEPRAHARVLLPTIEALLARAGLDSARLDGIVYGCGPGSFTGLRIGCAVAQGIAWAHELPTLGVSSLAVLAEAARREVRTEAAGVITVLDARMDECYVAVHGADGSAAAIVPDRIVARAALPELVAGALADRPGAWLLAGDVDRFAEDFAGLELELELVERARPDATALLALAEARLAGEGVPASEVHPVYLRDESRWRRQTPHGV